MLRHSGLENCSLACRLYEGVIENVTHEDAGWGNCVYEFPNPARRGFY